MIPPPPPPAFLILPLFLLPVAAQQNAPPPDNSIASFQPSLAVVIGMLSIMFSLTFILLLYAKFCHRASSSALHHSHQIHDSLIRSRSRHATSGLDRSLLESLPFFPFSSLNGSRHGLECAVCLTKFHDVDLLRLLPKCKHAFHIDCIDHWLHKHSTCPLCRHRVSPDDLSSTASLRFLTGHSELYVHRQESHHGSSRFSLGGSFRKASNNNDDESLPIQQSMDSNKALHKFSHKIVISDVVFNHRWSNVSSSDLMVLNSEMLNYVSSARFSSIDYREKAEEITENDPVMDIKKEMERKRLFESKVREIKPFPGLDRTRTTTSSESSKALTQNEKRSMSEIIAHPRRCGDSSSLVGRNVKEERRRKIWLPIARKTVQWFANRETTRTRPTPLHRPNV